MGEAVQEGGGHLGALEGLSPLGKGQVGGDDDRGLPVELGGQVEDPKGRAPLSDASSPPETPPRPSCRRCRGAGSAWPRPGMRLVSAMIAKLRLAAAKGLAHRIARQAKRLGYAPDRHPPLAPQPDFPDGLHRQHLLGPPFAESTKGAAWLRVGQFSTSILGQFSTPNDSSHVNNLLSIFCALEPKPCAGQRQGAQNRKTLRLPHDFGVLWCSNSDIRSGSAEMEQ